VVQNFVSGVILLVERPVKVGDWVTVDGYEGDIRRIRVRATEIQTFDRSTIIVPNSDLITKSVQNKTLWNSGSRVQLQLSIANPTDATRARDLILEVAKADQRILGDPAPGVFIDSLASGGAVNFNCYVYVASPRDVGRVRSDLYFALLEAFQKQTIAFNGAGGPQNLIVEPGPNLQMILTGAAAKEEEERRRAGGRH
jgi:potassium-dependent mechanosensitive channel